MILETLLEVFHDGQHHPPPPLWGQDTSQLQDMTKGFVGKAAIAYKAVWHKQECRGTLSTPSTCLDHVPNPWWAQGPLDKLTTEPSLGDLWNSEVSRPSVLITIGFRQPPLT